MGFAYLVAHRVEQDTLRASRLAGVNVYDPDIPDFLQCMLLRHDIFPEV